jgi:hypothetical protein
VKVFGAASLLREGTYVKKIRRKIWRKYCRFFALTNASLGKNIIITLVCEKNANFCAENARNRRKL